MAIVSQLRMARLRPMMIHDDHAFRYHPRTGLDVDIENAFLDERLTHVGESFRRKITLVSELFH